MLKFTGVPVTCTAPLHCGSGLRCTLFRYRLDQGTTGSIAAYSVALIGSSSGSSVFVSLSNRAEGFTAYCLSALQLLLCSTSVLESYITLIANT